MVTKTDLETVLETIHKAIHTKVATLRGNIAAHGGGIQAIETTMQAMADQIEASNPLSQDMTTCCLTSDTRMRTWITEAADQTLESTTLTVN
ncbi:Hypothetical predicted protein [Pelobates cultripes]|uniref:Uncharacterized protein n=1 Tax=Pelobates cultripes TaxID=61616 RepID=A0AAD1W9Z5_PELCU|nr:Hypothetical predicted protein [Pelobates cultripes]